MTRHGTRAQSGAAASTTATVEALVGLFSVIRITLSDDSTADARSSAASAQTGASLQPLKCCVSIQQLAFLLTTHAMVLYAGAGSVQNSSEALIALEGLQRLAVALPDQPSQEAQKPQEKPLPSRHDAPNAQVITSTCRTWFTILTSCRPAHVDLLTDIIYLNNLKILCKFAGAEQVQGQQRCCVAGEHSDTP